MQADSHRADGRGGSAPPRASTARSEEGFPYLLKASFGRAVTLVHRGRPPARNAAAAERLNDVSSRLV
jgi:hypothetical protein